MYCIKCGKQLPDDSRFCDSCGAQLVFDPAPETVRTQKEKVKKEKKPLTKKVKVIISMVCIILLLALAGGGYYYSYSKGVAYANNADIVNAKKWLFLPQITEQHDPNLLKLLDAEELLATGKYEEAEQGFRALVPYRNSAAFVNETMYQHALALEAEEKYQEALDILNSLATIDYRDSQAKIREDWQNYALAESHKEHYFDSLKILADAEKAEITFDSGVKQTIQNRAYEDAVKEYHQKHLAKASALFKQLDDYKRSRDYYALVEYRFSGVQLPPAKILSLIGFEDTGELFFRDNSAALAFLGEDTWSGSCGTMRIYTEKDQTYGSWTITGIPSGQWYFSEGNFYVSDVAQFSIEALSRDRVQIKILNSGKTYTMTR